MFLQPVMLKSVGDGRRDDIITNLITCFASYRYDDDDRLMGMGKMWKINVRYFAEY